MGLVLLESRAFWALNLSASHSHMTTMETLITEQDTDEGRAQQETIKSKWKQSEENKVKAQEAH